MKQFLVLAWFSLVIAGCATAKKVEPMGTPTRDGSHGEETSRSTKGSPEVPPATPIDYEALKRTVGLNRPKHQLGYIEKRFDGCGPQFGMLSGVCQRQWLISIQYRLLCRDSEGTVSEAISPSQLQAIPNQALSWKLKGLEGKSQTDQDGHGEVLTVSTISQKSQRLKLSNGDDFLYLNAGEVERLITPVNWCK
jgi:hypothetical protein